MIGSQLKCGMACTSLFVGLKGTKEELGLKAQNSYAFARLLVLFYNEVIFNSLKSKVCENKCLEKNPCSITLAGKRGFSAFSQFLKHLCRPIRSGLKLHPNLY